MKYKVSNLEWPHLDKAVAKAEGLKHEVGHDFMLGFVVYAYVAQRGATTRIQYCPSIDWCRGGPIIERERIEVEFHGMTKGEGPGPWGAQVVTRIEMNRYGSLHDKEVGRSFSGPTPLIAAMRAYVASKFGEEVELP
jgi:uncharacterized protein DUF2591